MKLIFIYGFPGVGKLTVARELAKLSGYKLFHNHLTLDLLGSVFEFGTEPFIELREKIWLSVFEEASKRKLDGLIFTFVFEKTVRGDFLDKIEDTLNDNDSIKFVKLTCDEAELKKRIKDKSREKFDKMTSFNGFKEMLDKGAIYEPKLSGVLELDITHLSPKKAAEKILDSI